MPKVTAKPEDQAALSDWGEAAATPVSEQSNDPEAAMLSEQPLISPEQDEPEVDLDVEVDAEGGQEEEQAQDPEALLAEEEQPIQNVGPKASERIQQLARQRREAQAEAAEAKARTAKLEATLERLLSAQETSLTTVQTRQAEAAQEQALRQVMHEIEQRFHITEADPQWHVMLNQERRILERDQKQAEFEKRLEPIQRAIEQAQANEVAAKYRAGLANTAKTMLAPFVIGPKFQDKILNEAYELAAQHQIGDPAQAIKMALQQYDALPRRKTVPVPPGNKIPNNVTRAGSSASAVGGRTKGQTGSGQARRPSTPEEVFGLNSDGW